MVPVRNWKYSIVKVRQPQFNQILKRRGLSYRDIARATGLDPSFVRRFAIGERYFDMPSIQKLERLRAFQGESWYYPVWESEYLDRRERLRATKRSGVTVAKVRYALSLPVFEQARLRQGLNVKQLSEKSGVTQQTIYRVLREPDTSNVTAPTAKALADALGVDVLDLFEIREDA